MISALPAEPRSEAALGPAEPSGQLAILLLEDDPAYQLIVRAELEDDGIFCGGLVTTDRLQSALTLIAERKFDIVLTDLSVPDSKGFKTFGRLFAAAPHIPIVVLSNQPDEAVGALILRHGAQDYAQKGRIGRGALSRIIQRAMDRHRYAIEMDRRAQLLAESEARFRVLVEHAVNYALVMLDPDGRVQTWNAGAERTVGFTAADSIGRSAVPFLIAEDGETERQTALLEKARSEGYACHEGWCQRSDGTRFWTEISLTAIRDSNDQLSGFAMMTHDLTRRKEAEQQRLVLEGRLRSAEKLQAIGRLAAGVAHEINTPAHFIGLNLDYLTRAFSRLDAILGRLAEGAALNADDRSALMMLNRQIPEALRDTSTGIKRVAVIVRALKEFSHPGLECETHLAQTNLNQAIETSLTVAQHEWLPVADVVRNLDPAIPPVPLFVGEFQQVILNLLVNAAQAISATGAKGKKGTLTITTGLDGDWAVVRIGDTGIGIPLEIRNRIFELFFTTKDVGQGTGQGLALAHAIITKRHRGEITFETEIGRGTTFQLRLPLSDRHPPEPNKTASHGR